MKHFVEARVDALNALSHPDLKAMTERSCLIVDLQGKIRVLAKPSAGSSSQDVHAKTLQIVAPAADVFWLGDVWVEEDRPPRAEKTLFDAVWAEAKEQSPGIYVLDRRLSKDAWLHAPFGPPWPLSEHTPPIVSFYSFKGGVGRTTAAAAAAINLARAGKKVVVLDFDLEAPGIASIFTQGNAAESELGVVDYLLEKSSLPSASLDISEFYRAYDDPAVIEDGSPIHVMPAGKLDDYYIEKLARINYEYLYTSAANTETSDSPIHQLFRSLRAKLKPDIILVDSRAGFHDLGGLSLSGIAHLQVLFGLNSNQSWRGLSIVVSHLGKEMILSGSPQRDCAIVQALAPPQDPLRKDQIRDFKERSFDVFSDKYYDDPVEPNGEWPVPDIEDIGSPHFPAVLTWDNRITGYASAADLAQWACEGEYRSLTSFILDKVGRAL